MKIRHPCTSGLQFRFCPEGVSRAPPRRGCTRCTLWEEGGGLWIWGTLLLKPSSWWDQERGEKKAQFDHSLLATSAAATETEEEENPHQRVKGRAVRLPAHYAASLSSNPSTCLFSSHSCECGQKRKNDIPLPSLTCTYTNNRTAKGFPCLISVSFYLCAAGWIMLLVQMFWRVLKSGPAGWEPLAISPIYT